LKSSYSILLICGIALAGCQTTSDGTTGGSTKNWQQAVSERNAKLNSPARHRFTELSDEAGFAAWAVAGHIYGRCEGMKASRVAGEFARPTFNRATVFKGKEKVAFAFEKAKADFAKKYGKALISDSNHCDAAQREMREQTAVSFFFDNNETGN